MIGPAAFSRLSRAGFARTRAIPLLAGWFVLVLGTIVLFGWFLRIPSIIKPSWSANGMAFSAALSFVLAGAACILAARGFVAAGRGVAALAGLLPASKFLAAQFGHDFSISGWLHLSVSVPASLAPFTALGLVAAAAVLFSARGPRGLTAEALLSGAAVTPLIVGVIPVASAVLGVFELTVPGPHFAAISMPSAIGLIALGAACLHIVLAVPPTAARGQSRLALPSAAIVAIALVTWAQFDSVLTTLEGREERSQSVSRLIEISNMARLLDLNVAQAELLHARAMPGRVPPDQAAHAVAKFTGVYKALTTLASGSPLEATVRAMRPELDTTAASLLSGTAISAADARDEKIARDSVEMHRKIAGSLRAVRQANPVTEGVLRQNLIAGWLVCAGLIGISLIALFLELRRRLRVEAILRAGELELQEKISRSTAELRAEVLENRATHLRLAESELRLRSTFEQAAVGLAHVSPEGRFVRTNERMCRITGYSQEELLEKNFGEITHPDDLKGDWERANAMLRGEPPASPREKRYIHRDGHIVWINVTGSLVRKPDGQPDYFIVVVEDITPRRAAEQMLRESERRFRWVVESSPVGIVQTVRSGDVNAANHAFYSLLGWTEEEFAAEGMNLRSITPGDWMERSDENIRDCIETGHAKVYEKEYFKRDGSRIPVLIGLSFENGVDGEAVAFVLDMSELKRTEQMLRASEQRFRLLVEVSPSALIMAGTDGCVRLVNVQTEKLFGYGRDEMIGRPVEMLVPGRFHSGHAGHRAGYLTAPEARLMGAGRDLFGVCKDGSEVPVEIGLNPVSMAEGDFVLATVVDITARKTAERSLRESARQLELLADAMPQIVWTNRPDGTMEYCNRRGSEFLDRQDAASETGWQQVIHPDDREMANNEWLLSRERLLPYEVQVRFWDRRRLAWRWHLSRALPIHDADGRLMKWVGTSTDIDDYKKLSEELEQRVDLRTADLKRSLLEKEVLLREVHHRVKNNLQIICSLLSMQVDCSDRSSGTAPIACLVAPIMEAHHRVRSMAMIHEHLYRSPTLGNFDFGEYIESLAMQLFQGYCVDPSRVGLELSVEPIQLTIDHAIPCGLILNELVSNALKHAFINGRGGSIRIAFRHCAPGRAELEVADNGIGLPAGFNIARTRSLGLQVVQSLSDQLAANLRIHSVEGTRIAFDWQVSAGGESAVPGPGAVAVGTT